MSGAEGAALCPEAASLGGERVASLNRGHRPLSPLEELCMAPPPSPSSPAFLESASLFGEVGAVSMPRPALPRQHSRSRGLGKPAAASPSLTPVCGKLCQAPWFASSGAWPGAVWGSRTAASPCCPTHGHGRGSEPLAWPIPFQAHIPWTTVHVFLRREGWAFPPQPQCLPGCLTPIWERKDTPAKCFQNSQTLRWVGDHASLSELTLRGLCAVGTGGGEEAVHPVWDLARVGGGRSWSWLRLSPQLEP